MNNDTRKLTAKMVTEALDMLRKKEYEHKGNVFILTESQYSALFGRLLAIELFINNPWVKTADKLPIEADADNTMCWVFATTKSSNLPMPEAIAYIRANPDNYPYWMTIPPLPKEQTEE